MYIKLQAMNNGQQSSLVAEKELKRGVFLYEIYSKKYLEQDVIQMF
jgi:hypothetical protein